MIAVGVVIQMWFLAAGGQGCGPTVVFVALPKEL